MRVHLPTTFVAFLVVATAAPAADKAPSDQLNEYLVDITGGSVSAAGLVGIDKGITQIETSQDIIVALQPLASGDNKAPFGLAITPARTALMPMAGSTYLSHDLYRLFGGLTLSYAQAKTTLSGADYRKSAVSAGTVYYFDKKQDPVFIGNRAFKECLTPELEKKNAADIDAIVRNTALEPAAKQAALEGMTGALNKVLTACIDDRLKRETLWNAGKASLSYGEAKIAKLGGESYQLAKTATLNIQYGIGDSALLAASIRATRNGLDLTTLGCWRRPKIDQQSRVVPIEN